MSRPFSIVALFLLGFNSAAASDATFLDAIAQVESGKDRKAVGKAGERGMYQMGRDAWTDAQTRLRSEGRPVYALSAWRDATAQDMTAAAYMRVLRSRFAAAGIADPTPEQIAVCWNMGWSAAVSRRFRPNAYAVRVGNIFRLAK